MTIPVSTRALLGRGKTWLRNRTKGGGLKYVGYSSDYAHSIATEEKNLPNKETAGGGYLESKEYITSFTGSMTVNWFNANNLAMAYRGGTITEDEATVSAEAHTAYTDSLVLFDHLPDMSATVTPVIAVSAARVDSTAYAKGATILVSAVVYQCTTAGTSDSSAPTFSTAVGTTTTDGTAVWTSRGAVAMVDGVDYQRGKSGIEILESASRFALGLPITVAYSQAAAEFVQLLTSSGDEYELVLDGLNEADGGTPFPITLYRVTFSPASNVGWKGDDYAAMPINFKVLIDSSKTGTGVSQYGKIGLPA